MWAHPAWQETSARQRLRSYATWCNAVEGNTTFYATPSRQTAQSWAEQLTGAKEFRFLPKLPKTVTHDQGLRGESAGLRAFLSALEPLEPHTHALWIQLSAAFGPTDLGALAGFLRALPRSYRYAVEVRHQDFFHDERRASDLERVLARVGAEWVPFDTTTLFGARPTSAAEREAWTKKPRVPRRMRALTEFPIVRYHGRDDEQRTVEGWQPWVAASAEWLREGRSPTVFVHTPDNASSLRLARRFHDEVRASVHELEHLPQPEHTEPMTLF
ncbi:DUF72 domain-containing protein [Nocardia callitridis]|uniref:DUF72 domain-containing protein n=2 Tax=Nocardia callitridis TaxID=648753 RepID=A0ABP9KU26_9NOCA